MNKKIIVKIPLVSYLKTMSREYENPYLTKTYGGQIWISDQAPGEAFEDEGKNYIEFNDSFIYMRLPKETWEHIKIEKGTNKKLSSVIKDIQKLEKQLGD